MATTKKTTSTPKEETHITTTQTGTCKTLSGKGRVDYAVGKDAAGQLHYRITKNAGGGHYSNEWLPADAIHSLLGKEKEITAAPLRDLGVGKSVNTAGFILAVLAAEGVVELIPGKKRYYRYPVAKEAATHRTSPKKPAPKTHARPAKKSTTASAR